MDRHEATNRERIAGDRVDPRKPRPTREIHCSPRLIMHVSLCVHDAKRGILPLVAAHAYTTTRRELFQRSRNCSLAASDIVIASRQTDGKHLLGESR